MEAQLTTKFNDNPRRQKTTRAQAVIYGLMAVGTLSGLVPYCVGVWRYTHPKPAPALAQAATGAHAMPSTGASAAQRHGTLISEVRRQTTQWQAQRFVWNLTDHPAVLRDVLAVDVADLEAEDMTPNRFAVEKGGDGLPTLAGPYRRERVCASDWPHQDSIAIELLPMSHADPEHPTKPWRVVLLFGTSNQASGLARQAVADGRVLDETIPLGRDGSEIPAVPVDRTETDGVVTFWCLCPVQATLGLSGIRLMQRAEPTVSPEQASHNRWQVLHDAFLSKERQRANAATTPEQKAAIAKEIDEWKTENPEPPRASPNAANDGVNRQTATLGSNQ